MADYDVFNGDADGICALVQLRQVEPRDVTLITGVKRDITLLKQVDASVGDRITVLDISMAKNKLDLIRVLSEGANVFYVDHHSAGEVPISSSLMTLINEAADISSSLLVNQYLRGARLGWGVVGTFGDNLKKVARGMLGRSNFSLDQVDLLEKLGIYMNYNGYGSDLNDLHFTPTELYQLVVNYDDPLDFITDSSEHFDRLETGYHQDFAVAESLQPLRASTATAVYMLPDQPWARRVSGVFSNGLTNHHPARAHAVITQKSTGNYVVSVRASLLNKQGANKLCSQFPSGGGREAAAGINDLPSDQLDRFIDTFEHSFGTQ